MSGEATLQRSADRIIHTVAHLSCDARRAFEMFTVNELLQSWLALKAEVTTEVGGKYELFWEPDERENNSTIGCRITALEADRFLPFEWKGPKQFKQFMNDADPLTHVVVFFLPAGPRSTDVHLIHSGWRSDARWEEARRWFDVSWRGAFAALEAQVNRDRSSPVASA
ncbi:MAG TPA: SRPBCC domain-containing protein [Pyrinomonadaceae bacterium]|nr:SRPBCC domain-containing protein [Pyrinomonadaceae bacterium]